ncbi:glycosyltransferase [Micrococcus lylae]|uniref:glycosyltransferase n=1 Tax=Micrococcus lylae TaxID=1273 RepID=UPI0021A5BAC9|nr:glycosyltransferase [Micrococcus lylae]MCT2007860.1 glycosyltransferase [Micrococcus lylae]MCT2071591.1 glycosyltransferase [Micrococcus lylae]
MPLIVQPVPADHPYVRHLLPLPDSSPDGERDAAAGPSGPHGAGSGSDATATSVEHLPDPKVPGAEPGVWWPPSALTPEWIREHRPDVLHVHFGFEHFTPAQLQAAMDAADDVGTAVLVTVHDLENPHLPEAEQPAHRVRLAVLLAAADEVVTLSTGAAEAVRKDYGREAIVIPHPHVLPLDREDEDAAGEGPGPGEELLVLVHAKDLRASVDPEPLLPAVAEGVRRLRAQGRPAQAVLEMQETTQDPVRADRLRASAEELGIRVWEHPRLDDASLHALLRRAAVSVLPYVRGTHSGWVEMCRDLGTPVVVTDVGAIASQVADTPLPGEQASEAGRPGEGVAVVGMQDPAAAAEAIRRMALSPRKPAPPLWRRTQRAQVAAAHAAACARAVRTARRQHAERVAVLVITGDRDTHLARVLQALERQTRRPDEVVVVFMGQPDGQVPETDLPVTVGHVAADGHLPLAAARNRAAALASAEILMFLDVDCLPADGTVEQLAAEVADHPHAMVMGTPRYLLPDWRERTGLAEAALPEDAALRAASVPHGARAHLPAGDSEQWHMVWTLVLAMRRSLLQAIGGLDEGYVGYGAEDTDLAFRARDAGMGLRFHPAEVFHQHHGVHRPPLNHLEDILVNARRFRAVHGLWPMEGWLREFAAAGLVDWDEDGGRLELRRRPTEQELAAAKVADAAY